MERDSISVIYLTTAGLSELLGHLLLRPAEIDRLGSVRFVFCMGEVLPDGLAERFGAVFRSRGPAGPRLVSAYGSREISGGAAYFEHVFDPGSGPSGGGFRTSGRTVLGEPASGMSFHVFQGNGEPAPEGVPGDLYVGGRQLATGYFQDPEATRRDFVKNPFWHGENASRLFRTGDMARRVAGGGLEYLGRAGTHSPDRRIDPRRIEHELRGLPDVRDATVVHRETHPGVVRLVAHVVRETLPRGGMPETHSAVGEWMNARLRHRLPEYMLPWSYVFLDHLPLTPHGHLDTEALPAPEGEERSVRRSVAMPTREIDVALARIWCDVLRRSVVADDNFFDLGGHSILAIQLVSNIRRTLQVEIPVTLVFEAPVLWSMADRIEALRDGDSGRADERIVSPEADQDEVVPLSYEQERLWFVHEHMEEQRTSYNITVALHFEGAGFSTAALGAAFDALVARHETLRTCFFRPEEALAPRQRIVGPWKMEIGLRSASPQDVAELAREMSREVFDLGTVPLLRADVLQLAKDAHIVLINMHHIVSDGWSFSVLLGELQQFYDARVRGRPLELPPLPVQYADYVRWQRRQDFGPHLAYWKGTLSAYEDGLDLPYDRPRTADRAWRAATLQVHYPAALAERLDRFSRDRRCSLFMSLAAGFAVVLNQYTRREDLCFGTTVAGRDDVELEKLIGFFINILALRIDLSGDPSLEDVLRRTRQTVLTAFEHRALPFEHVLNGLRKPRDSSLIPLVPVILRHQNFPRAHVENWSEGVILKRFEMNGDRTTASEMDWQFYGDGPSLVLELEYASDLFSEATARRMVEHHQRVLEAMVEDPRRRLAEFSVLTRRERELYAAANKAASAPAVAVGIVERFERQVEATPDEAACIGVSAGSGERSLTYRELNARANQIARRLRTLGAGAESRVAVFSDRSPELLAGLLGIFKVGACYVPVDPDYPSRYVERILNDVRPTVMLGRREVAARLPAGRHVDGWLDLDAAGYLEDADIAGLSEANLAIREPVHALQLASVAYTSGSTGEPKGVMVPYGQIENWLRASRSRSPYGREERTLQKTPSAFVVSLKEMLDGLLEGVPLVIVPDLVVKDSVELVKVVERWQITRMNLVPSHLCALLEEAQGGPALRSLRTVVTAGEALPQSLRSSVAELLPGAELWNNYGCTELNDVTYARVGAVNALEAAFVPIGTPIDNVRVFVLDEHLRRVPVGVTGELCIDSPYMARGYWQQPGLTAERFMANPYGETPGSRLYRTGDMVRWLADGSLEYLGRRDFEIKVRGHRIDVRQVEKVLHSWYDVQSAVVGARDGSQLVAYLVSREQASLDMPAIRRHVSEHLPTYMVPTLYMQLPALPKLPNGKLDRNSLPTPSAGLPERAPDEGPSDELERRLATIFSEVLGVKEVAPHDNFFDLGGHSLLASQLASHVRHRFGIDLPIAAVFEHPTVAQLAEDIAWRLANPACRAVSRIGRLASDRTAPLSYQQERLWFVHHHIEEQRTSYNGTTGLRVRGPLRVDAMREAFRALVVRHEILRTTFQVPTGAAGPAQVVHDFLDPDIFVGVGDEADVTSHMDALSGHVYDLENGPLLIVRVLKLGEDDHALLIGMHHIVYDGWSQLNIMIRDLNALYAAQLGGTVATLPVLPVQYADYATWQRSQNLDGHAEYWKTRLQGYQDDLELPTDHLRPANQNWHAASVAVDYPDALARDFARFNRAHGATLFMGLVASFAVVLGRFTGRTDLCIGTTVSGRGQVELENLIGFFVNVVPLRLDLSGDPDVAELVARVKSTVLSAFEHQAFPFEQILGALSKQRDNSRVSLVPIVVRHQNFPTTVAGAAGGLTMEAIARDERTTPNELDLQFFGDGASLKVVVEYPAELYSETTVRRIIRYHHHVIETMLGISSNSGQHCR